MEVAALSTGWAANTAARVACEKSLAEAMKHIEKASRIVSDASDTLIPYSQAVRHQTACALLSRALDTIFYEHRHAINALLFNDRPAPQDTSHHI